MFSILKPIIFSLDPETAHDFAINSQSLTFYLKNFKVENEEMLETSLFNERILTRLV